MTENMTDEQGLRLTDLLDWAEKIAKTVFRFWLPILLVTLLAAGGTMLYSILTYVPYYESEVTFSVNTQESTLITGSGSDQVRDSLPYILSSQHMKNLVMEELGISSFPATTTLESKQLAKFFVLRVRAEDAETSRRVLKSIINNCPRASVYVLGKISLDILDISDTQMTPVNQNNPLRAFVMGAAVCFVCCVLLVWLYLKTKRTIVSEEDLKRYLSAAHLASLPQITFKKRRKNIDKTVHIKNPKVGSGFIETVHAMRSRVHRLAQKGKSKTILVTSSLPGEGKSTVAANLALSLAEKKHRVLLLDLDLRNPSVCSVLGLKLENVTGLSDILSAQSANYRIYYNKVWNLYLIPGGEAQRNPVDLLNSPYLAEMLDQLRAAFDYVILDTPPTAMLSDASTIAAHADAAIYVVRQDFARIERIAEGMETLSQAHLPIMGIVLNGMETSAHSYGGYHRYAYGRYGGYGGYGSYGSYGHYGYADEKDEDKPADPSGDFIDLSTPWERKS